MLFIFKDKESLLEAADEAASKADDEFQRATRLYYVVRYFMAAYESEYGQILIQVWNEYRSAIDHFFRYQAAKNENPSAEDQIRKMEGHIQRAAFDILKLYSHETFNRIVSIRQEYSVKVFNRIDNGEFLPKFSDQVISASRLFTNAKVSDDNLGKSSQHDNDVLERYLDAALSAHVLAYELEDKKVVLDKAKLDIEQEEATARDLSKSDSFFMGLKSSTIVTIVASCVTFLIGLVVPSGEDITNQGQEAEVLTETSRFGKEVGDYTKKLEGQNSSAGEGEVKLH